MLMLTSILSSVLTIINQSFLVLEISFRLVRVFPKVQTPNKTRNPSTRPNWVTLAAQQFFYCFRGLLGKTTFGRYRFPQRYSKFTSVYLIIMLCMA